MSASLLEMVLAISIAGLIFACALIPMTQTVVAYQEAELNQQRLADHTLAVVRAEQIAGSVWRNPNAPADTAPLLTATASRLRTGTWELRARAGNVEQRRHGGRWGQLASPAASFSFSYLLNNGAWVSALNTAQRDRVIAVRANWTDSADNVPCGGATVFPDRAFSAAVLNLAQPPTGGSYERADLEHNLTFSLGTWP